MEIQLVIIKDAKKIAMTKTVIREVQTHLPDTFLELERQKTGF